MTLVLVRLDHQGLGQILVSGDFINITHSAAERVAAEVRNRKRATVVVTDSVTGRRAPRATSVVEIRHPAGRVWQAREGILTRSAAAAGLEVGRRP